MTESAADLIELAREATTSEELDYIESKAEGRVTVINAVHDRRDQLAAQAAREEDMPEAPVVDPSPTAPPIMLGSQEYVFPPAEASPPEVLELEPNTYEKATEGPHPQVSQTMYVHMTRPDGGEFLAPISNVEHYEAKGFTAGAEEDIPDLVAYQAERAGTAPPAAPEPPPEEPA